VPIPEEWKPSASRVYDSHLVQESGCEATVEQFREAQIAVKTGKYPNLTDEDLAFAKNQAGDYCVEVNRRLGGTKLSRVFILKAEGAGWRQEGEEVSPR
jgi:hypothetical protein